MSKSKISQNLCSDIAEAMANNSIGKKIKELRESMLVIVDAEISKQSNKEIIEFGNQTITAAGTYYNVVSGNDACDSVVELTVTLNCIPTPFTCPTMLAVVNEGPNQPDHLSYIATINPATGALGRWRRLPW